MSASLRLCLLVVLCVLALQPLPPAVQAYPELPSSPTYINNWIPLPTSGAPIARSGFRYAWAEELGDLFIWGGVNEDAPAPGLRYHLETDTWETLPEAPIDINIISPSIVWTGDELIIWGGFNNNSAEGARYNPATNIWKTMASLNAPSPRILQGTVWTGSANHPGEMLVWGGRSVNGGPLGDGARYNPATDTWTPISAINAPSPRDQHTAVWTGSGGNGMGEMIIWGGETSNYILTNTGGRYNPETDTWSPVDAGDAPSARTAHTAVWTGTRMIIWGGIMLGGGIVANGSAYDPSLNSWTAIPVSPIQPRGQHSAIWTGNLSSEVAAKENGEMIVWGGYFPGSSMGDIYQNDGARYNPATGTWTLLPIPANFSGRSNAAAIWTGPGLGEMFIWGGRVENGIVNSGARYNLAQNSWTLINSRSIPTARTFHTAIWAGTKASLDGKMIVWGGMGSDGKKLNTGESYNPLGDTWSSISDTGAPAACDSHSAIWTDEEMLVWGGLNASNQAISTGGRYNPITDSWKPTATLNTPTPRWQHTAIWTGSQDGIGEMIIWGGNLVYDSTIPGYVTTNTGARYNPATDTWTPMSTINAPEPRAGHTAVWTGTEMIVWGGYSLGVGSFNTGARYNPITDTWTALPIPDFIQPRVNHAAAWAPVPTKAGTLVIWGGHNQDAQGNGIGLNDGARLDLATGTWLPLSGGGPVSTDQSFIWTGTELVVWGGYRPWPGQPSSGAYNPATDTWKILPLSNQLYPRLSTSLVWAGSPEFGELIIWGGHTYHPTNTGARLVRLALPSRAFVPYLSYDRGTTNRVP